MGLLSLEHSPTVYWADFAWHAAVALGLVAAGAVLWSLVEYLLHRFVLLGLSPFKHWPVLHHHAPAAGGDGVSTGLWDRLFASVPTPGLRRPTTGHLPSAPH